MAIGITSNPKVAGSGPAVVIRWCGCVLRQRTLSTLSKSTQLQLGTGLYRGDGLMSHPGEVNDIRLRNISEIRDKH